MLSLWQAMKHKEVIEGKTLEQRVERMMHPKNLKIEGRDENGRWVELHDNDLS